MERSYLTWLVCLDDDRLHRVRAGRRVVGVEYSYHSPGFVACVFCYFALAGCLLESLDIPLVTKSIQPPKPHSDEI